MSSTETQTAHADLTPVDLKALRRVIGRALVNKKTRGQLRKDPEEALKLLGYQPTPAAVEFFAALKQKNFYQAIETQAEFLNAMKPSKPSKTAEAG